MICTSSSISLWKTIALGDYLTTYETFAQITCGAVASVPSIMLFASLSVRGGFVWTNVLRSLASVSCVRLHMPLAAGFLLVVGTFFIPESATFFWNSQPVNSPALSWRHKKGLGYLDHQDFMNLVALWSKVLLTILIRSARPVIQSILAKAKNS